MFAVAECQLRCVAGSHRPAEESVHLDRAPSLACAGIPNLDAMVFHLLDGEGLTITGEDGHVSVRASQFT